MWGHQLSKYSFRKKSQVHLFFFNSASVSSFHFRISYRLSGTVCVLQSAFFPCMYKISEISSRDPTNRHTARRRRREDSHPARNCNRAQAHPLPPSLSPPLSPSLSFSLWLAGCLYLSLVHVGVVAVTTGIVPTYIDYTISLLS